MLLLSWHLQGQKWHSRDPFFYQVWKSTNQSEWNDDSSLKIILPNPLWSEALMKGKVNMLEKQIRGGFVGIDMIKRQHVSSFPMYVNSSLCTVVLMTNMVHPEYLHVTCNQNYTHDVLCMGKPDNNFSFTEGQTADIIDVYCEKGNIKSKGKCYKFIFGWPVSTKNITQICKAQNKQAMYLKDVAAFLYELELLIDAVTLSLPGIISVHHTSEPRPTKFHYDSVLDKSLTQVEEMSQHNLCGTFACWSHAKHILQSAQLFRCHVTGAFILNYFLCDQKAHCPQNDASDESQCANHGTKAGGQILCSALFIFGKDGQCTKVVGSPSHVFVSQNSANSAELHSVESASSGQCHNTGQMPCDSDQEACFAIADICSYYQDDNSNLYPCSNGRHLENCTHFECTGGMFKCPQHYCIPWRYLCDNKWDCPAGVDEQHGNICGKNAECRGLLKCTHSMTCIHLSAVCDHATDCPFGDDESFCELKSTVCPKWCQCLVLALSCHHLSWVYFENTYQFVKVYLYCIDMMDLKDNNNRILLSFPNAVHISFENVNLKVMYFQHLSQRTTFLSLANNRLTSVQFVKRANIIVLLLQNNSLISISERLFASLRLLKLLNISHNPIADFSVNLFHQSAKLTLISLHHVNPPSEHLDSFEIEDLQFIEATELYFCCLNTQSKCKVSQQWYESCADLIPSVLLSNFFVTACVLVPLIHLLSIICHCFMSDLAKAFKTIIVGHETMEVASIVHFIIILVNNSGMSGRYFLHIKNWKSGIPCRTGFAIALWSCLVSPIVIFTLSVARAKVVTSPMKTKFKRTKFTLRCVVGCFVSTFVPVVCVAVSVRTHCEHFAHELCSPFLDNTKSFVYVPIVTAIVSVVQITCAIGSLLAHIVLLMSYKKSKQTVTSQTNSTSSTKSIFVQLLFVSLADVVFLVPSNVGFFVLQGTPQYPLTVPYWLVLNQPLHSLSVSVIFIVVLLSKRCQSSWNAHRFLSAQFFIPSVETEASCSHYTCNHSVLCPNRVKLLPNCFMELFLWTVVSRIALGILIR